MRKRLVVACAPRSHCDRRWQAYCNSARDCEAPPWELQNAPALPEGAEQIAFVNDGLYVLPLPGDFSRAIRYPGRRFAAMPRLSALGYRCVSPLGYYAWVSNLCHECTSTLSYQCRQHRTPWYGLLSIKSTSRSPSKHLYSNVKRCRLLGQSIAWIGISLDSR